MTSIRDDAGWLLVELAAAEKSLRSLAIDAPACREAARRRREILDRLAALGVYPDAAPPIPLAGEAPGG